MKRKRLIPVISELQSDGVGGSTIEEYIFVMPNISNNTNEI
jgi:hypothetical protein